MVRKHRRRGGPSEGRIDRALARWAGGGYPYDTAGGCLLGVPLAVLATIRDWWRGGDRRR